MSEEILFEYVCGDLSREDKHRVEQWYEQSKDNAALLELIYEAYTLQKSIDVIQRTDVGAALSNFKERVRRKEQVLGINRLKLIKYSKRIAVAAILTSVIVLSSIWCVDFVSRVQRPMVVTTNIGERVQIELPDGSKVWLNACSKIKYGTSLLGTERKVEMSGEAYFEVVNDKDAPFVVECNSMNVKVLGTKFNVRANDDEDILTTTLFEGSVLVESPMFRNKKDIVMKPDQELHINKKNGAVELTTKTYAGINADWVTGKLRFDNNSFDEIAKSLQRNYNIEIIFKDDIVRHKKFTCDFATSDNIYRIFSILELTGTFKYEIKGRQVEVSSL